MTNIYYIDNLPDKQKNRFASENITVLTPEELMDKELHDTDALIVLCEVNVTKNGNTVNRTDFYGISFVQELRRKNYKNKVLFVSFLPENYFKEKLLKILFFPGHSFMQLPSLPTEWLAKFKTFESLTDLSLYDVKHHYCSVDQIIDEQFHSLAPKYNVAKKLTPQLIDEGNKLVKLVYGSLSKPLPELNEILNTDVSGTEALRSLKNLCEAALPESTSREHDEIQPEWKYWKVLWLDDEENNESPLYKELIKRLGAEEKVILCKTYEEAVEQWEADKAYGEISLVICDYRLKNEDGLPTSKQGYDFMKYLAKCGRSVCKIAYSALKRKFLIESFRHYGIQINIFSKIDFNQHNPDDLAFLTDEIIRLGDNHWIEINNAPQATEWTTIAPIYRSFKNGFSFYTFQNYVSRLAKQNLEVFINDFNNQKKKENLWNLTFTDSFKVRTGSFPKSDDNKTDAIKEILIARRFAVGLFAFLKSERNKQSSLLYSGNYLDYIKVILYNSASNGEGYTVGNLSDSDVYTKIKKHSTLKLLSKFNALTFDSTWPLGLLPEEFGWLKFDMGLVKETYNEIYSYLRQVQIIKNNFQTLFSDEPFNELITKNDGALKISGGKIHFNDDNAPLIRNTADAKKIIQSVYDSLDINDYNAYRIFISFWRSLVSQFIKGDFKASGLLPDFLYFITKTLKANKYNFDEISIKLVKQDAKNLQQLLNTLLAVGKDIKARSNELDSVNTQSLNSLENFKELSPYSKIILKNILNAMLDPSKIEEVLSFLHDILGRIEENDFEGLVSKIKASRFVPSNFKYTVEQEYMIKHCPWEIVFPKHQRLSATFQNISDEILEAIKTKETTYKNSLLENKDNIFSDAFIGFIEIFYDSNNNSKYTDIYFEAIDYSRSRAKYYNEQKLTDNRDKPQKSGNRLSATDYAENKLAQKSYQEQIDYYSNLLDEDENLRIDNDPGENVEDYDIW